MASSFDKPTVFGGVIWIDTNGTFIYECKFCQKQSVFAKSIEMHMSREHAEELRPKQTVPCENRPLLPQNSDERRYRLPPTQQPLPSLPLPPSSTLPPSQSKSHSQSHSKAQITVSAKSSRVPTEIARHKTNRRRSNSFRANSPPKRMKLNDDKPASTAAVEFRKQNPFASSNNRARPPAFAAAPKPTSTSSSKQSTGVGDRIYFGSRHSDPVKPKLPQKRTILSTDMPVHSTVKCNECSQKFNDVDSLQSHTQHCHKLVCIYCQTEQPKPFKTEQGFWGHQRKQHAVIFKYQCSICVRAFKHRSELDEHSLSCFRNRIKFVQCGYCLRPFSSTFQKNEHVKANHQNCLAKKPIV